MNAGMASNPDVSFSWTPASRRPLFMWDPVLLVLTLPMSIKVLRGCLWACPRDPSSANVSLAAGVDQGKDDSQASVQ